MAALSGREFQQAVSLVRAGRLKEARPLLEALLQADRSDEQAWLWLSRCYTSPERRRAVLQAGLKAIPGSVPMLDELAALGGQVTAHGTPNNTTPEFLQSLPDDEPRIATRGTPQSGKSSPATPETSQGRIVQAGLEAPGTTGAAQLRTATAGKAPPPAGSEPPGRRAESPTGNRRVGRLILLLVTAILLGVLLIAGWFARRYLLGRYSFFPPTTAVLPTPSPGEWHELAPLEEGRAWHAAALLADGRILLAGGMDDFQSLGTAWLFDRNSNTWQVAAALPEGRDSHSLTALADGRALVLGGQNNDGLPLASAELYDPEGNGWLASMPLFCHGSGHTATLLRDGRVLVAGGLCVEGSRPVLAGAELFDPASGTWSPAGNMLQLRNGHTASLLPDGRVLVAGGAGSEVFATSEIYDPRTNTWQAASPMIMARTEHAAAALAGGGVLVAGGVNKPPGVTDSVELYDLQSGRWSDAGRLPAPSLWGALSALPDGRGLLAGGTADLGFGEVSRQAWYFDPQSTTWQPAPEMPEARAVAAAVDLPGGQLWLSGGKGDGGMLLPGTLLYAPLIAPPGGETAETAPAGPTEPWRTPTLQLPPSGLAGQARLWLSLPAPTDLEEPPALPAFNADGSQLAVAGGHNSLGLWQVNEARKVRTFNAGQPLAGAGFSPDGRLLAGITRRGQLVVWDTLGGQELWLLEPGSVDVPCVLDWWAFSPDSSLLAAGFCTGGAGCSKQDFLSVWDLATGRVRIRLEKQTGGAFSPDGRVLLTFSRSAPQDGLRAWDLVDGELQAVTFARFKPGSRPLMAFSPDSSRLAFERQDETPLAIWDLGRGVPVLSVQEPLEDLAALVYSPDGGLLAADSRGGVTRAWDPMTGERVFNFDRGGLFSAPLFSLRNGLLTARSNDGRRVQAFDALSGNLLADFRGRPDRAVVFSPDGYTLAALGVDGAVQVYHYGEPPKDYTIQSSPAPATTPTP